MGEAKRKKQRKQASWPSGDGFRGMIELHMLPSVAEINGARIRELTGETTIPEDARISLQTYRAIVGERAFQVGFCLGDGERFSAIGLAVVERLKIAAPGAALHVVRVLDSDIAWDIVLRHLRSFIGNVLLFVFPNSDVFDAGTAPKFSSPHIQMFDEDGQKLARLTSAQRREIRERKAATLNRPSPPAFYPASTVDQEDCPWIFRFVTPVGKEIRTAVWDGRRDYAHAFSEDIVRWVGGERIAIVQVDSPVGINRRSSLDLTNKLSTEFDGIIHWARDTQTFESILASFVRLDLESVSPPTLPEGWEPEVTILAANGDRR
ncbi:hypothetical protein [Bradyrhizobium manausense]|uniref:Uncharacterized protein n=1 Tax=Bradyrhizobium manausense TaxID=989370 RepID=A0A0R3E0X7_9BRAD|nr:hypothetical protein [Bradyrhizobium manausense]KRQ15776.1 hypothetical protein AOQ71_07725 [Bradyrhizobium manausense]